MPNLGYISFIIAEIWVLIQTSGQTGWQTDSQTDRQTDMAQLTSLVIQFSIIYTWEPHLHLPVTFVYAQSKYTRFWPFSIVAGYRNLNACRALLSVAAQWLPAPFCLCNLSSTIITSTWGYHFLCGLNFSRTRIGTGTDLLIPSHFPSLSPFYFSLFASPSLWTI